VKINPQKSDLICYNTSSEREINIGDCKVSRSTCTKHLGISRNEKNSINIDEKLKSGRAAIYGMLGAGLHLRKGFSPLISHNLWKVYAVPKILYGLEVMSIKKKEMEHILCGFDIGLSCICRYFSDFFSSWSALHRSCQ
jgi:hypothetical protein